MSAEYRGIRIVPLVEPPPAKLRSEPAGGDRRSAVVDAREPLTDEALEKVLVRGLQPGRVTLIDYDPTWPAAYARHRGRIELLRRGQGAGHPGNSGARRL